MAAAFLSWFRPRSSVLFCRCRKNYASTSGQTIRSTPMPDVLRLQGKTVLAALGLSNSDQDRVLSGWRHLRDRRHRTSHEVVAERD